MNCPKCKAAMSPVEIEGITVDRCDGCGGLWFDLREHEHLKEIEGSEKIDTGSRGRGQSMDAVRDIDCPKCSTQMVKLGFHDQPDIHYEQCTICGGAFLDAGEFSDYKENAAGEWVGRWVKRFKRS